MLPLLLSGPETSWRQASLCLLSFGFFPFLSYFLGSSPTKLCHQDTCRFGRPCLKQTPHPQSYPLLPWRFPVLSPSSSHPPEANLFFQCLWSRVFHVEQLLSKAEHEYPPLVVLCHINMTALVIFLLFLTQIQVRSVFSSSFESHPQ